VGPESTKYFFHGDTVIDGSIVVAAADAPSGASVHAFERSTGRELWRYPAGSGANGPLAGLDRRVYAATIDRRLIALEVEEGSLAWSVPLKLPGFEGPAVADGRVFAGDVDGTLHALSAETGREQWRVELGAPVSTSIKVSAGDVYAGTKNGSIHRVNAKDGKVMASLSLDSSLWPAGVPVRTPSALLVLLDDQAADHRSLVSIDPALTRVHWRVTAPKSWSTSRVFLWGDVALLGTSSGEVGAYCSRDGAPAWSRSVSGTVRSIGGAGDTVLVGTPAGDLYALKAPRSCDGQ
jgi:outer membrane protein assembly factor BamB